MGYGPKANDGMEIGSSLPAGRIDPAMAGSRLARWRADLVACAILTLVWLGVWAPRLRGPIDLRWDASVYYILGTALAEGKGYRLLNEPGEIEAVQYPPGLPLLVATQVRALGTSDYLEVAPRLRLVYCLLSGLYLLTAYALARRLLQPSYAVVVGVLTVLSFDGFLQPSDALYAELPFGLVSLGFLLCQVEPRRPGREVVQGVLGAAAYLLRTAGVALLAAWVAESLLRRRFRQAALRAVVAAVPVALWQAHIWSVTTSREYREPAYTYQRAPYYYTNVTYAENGRLRDPFRPELGQTRPADLPWRIARNLAAVPGSLGESVWVAPSSLDWYREKARHRLGLSLPPNSALAAVLALLGCVILVGAALTAASSAWFLALYFGLTVALICLTPWPGQFWRYLSPLVPLSLVFLIQALRSWQAWLERGARWGRIANASVVAVPLALMGLFGAAVAGSFLRHMPLVTYYDTQGRERSHRLLTYGYGSEWQVLNPAFEWVRRHADRAAVVATAVPHLAYLRTGHPAVLPPMEADPASERRLLDLVPVSYVVLDGFEEPGVSRRYAAPAVQGRPAEWRQVFEAPGGGAQVYERVR
jgi:hypothetical protein